MQPQTDHPCRKGRQIDANLDQAKIDQEQLQQQRRAHEQKRKDPHRQAQGPMAVKRDHRKDDAAEKAEDPSANRDGDGPARAS